MSDFDLVLEAIQKDVQALLEKVEPVLPTVLRLERAARELDVHPSTIKRMIKSGEIQAVKIHGRMGIPRSEIERISSPPTPQLRRSGGRRRATKYDPRAEQAAVREGLRRRR